MVRYFGVSRYSIFACVLRGVELRAELFGDGWCESCTPDQVRSIVAFRRFRTARFWHGSCHTERYDIVAAYPLAVDTKSVSYSKHSSDFISR